MPQIFGFQTPFEDAKESAPVPEIHPLAQAMELRERWQRAQTRHDIKPGDLVRFKQGLTQHKGDDVMILWRMLDSDNKLDWVIISDFISRCHTSTADCLVAFLGNSGRTVVIVAADFSLLEPYNPQPVAP